MAAFGRDAFEKGDDSALWDDDVFADPEDYLESQAIQEDLNSGIDALLRTRTHLENARLDNEGTAAKAAAAAAVPIGFDKTYEVSALPVGGWAFFQLRVERRDALGIDVAMQRLDESGDGCLFIRGGAKPTQQLYDSCSYETWSRSERSHALSVDDVAIGSYFVGVWNTPVFGRADARVKVKCKLRVAPPKQSWLDEKVGVTAELKNIRHGLRDVVEVLDATKGDMLQELAACKRHFGA